MSDATLLTRVRVPGSDATRILVRGGRIAGTGGDGLSAPGAEDIDCRSELVLPALVDGHIHLDKTVTGLPWMPHAAGPDRRSRIDTEARLRATLPPVAERASNLVRQCIAHGTTAIRTHVDVTPALGLSHLEALLEVRARFADAVRIQIVAFPQTGVASAPGTADLLDRAMTAGADLVGGIDPLTFDGDTGAQYDLLFDIAARHGAGVDVHLHHAGDQGLREIDALVAHAARHALPRGVTVSHGFALGAAPEDTVSRLGERMAAAGVSLVTHGGGASPLPPVNRLRALGVEVFAGNDDVRDPWSPFGTGDMLERAMLLAWRSGFRTDPDLGVALECASLAGGRALALEPHGLEPGMRADLVTVACETPAEAVATRAARGLVFNAGRLVARDGTLLPPHGAAGQAHTTGVSSPA